MKYNRRLGCTMHLGRRFFIFNKLDVEIYRDIIVIDICSYPCNNRIIKGICQ